MPPCTEVTSYKWGHLNIFISRPERNFHKNIDGTVGDIDNSIKEAQEGKSQKEPQSASKFGNL